MCLSEGVIPIAHVFPLRVVKALELHLYLVDCERC